MNKLVRAKKEEAAFNASIVTVIKATLKKHYSVVKVTSTDDDIISVEVSGRGNMTFVTSEFTTDMYRLQKRIVQKESTFSWSATPKNIRTLEFVFRL